MSDTSGKEKQTYVFYTIFLSSTLSNRSQWYTLCGIDSIYRVIFQDFFCFTWIWTHWYAFFFTGNRLPYGPETIFYRYLRPEFYDPAPTSAGTAKFFCHRGGQILPYGAETYFGGDLGLYLAFPHISSARIKNRKINMAYNRAGSISVVHSGRSRTDLGRYRKIFWLGLNKILPYGAETSFWGDWGP